MVLTLFTGLVPAGGIAALERIPALFPLNFSNFNMLFSVLESYQFGLVVLDLIHMVLAAYLVLAFIATPIAAVSFRRHQVA